MRAISRSWYLSCCLTTVRSPTRTGTLSPASPRPPSSIIQAQRRPPDYGQWTGPGESAAGDRQYWGQGDLDPVRAPDQTGARLWHTDSRGGAEQVALSLLHKLLTEPDAGASMMSGPVGHTVRSTLAGAKSHFLLTLAHYTYFQHRPRL